MRTLKIMRSAFYAVLCVCTVVMLSVGYLCVKEHSEYRQVRQVLVASADHSHSALDDYDWLADNLETYRDYQSSGLLTDTDSLRWMDLLASLNQQLLVENYQFELSAVENSELNNITPLQLMDINIYGELMHDGVLAELLSQITEEAPGGWVFRSLEVTREGDAGPAVNGLQESELERQRLSVTLSLRTVSILPMGNKGGAV